MKAKSKSPLSRNHIVKKDNLSKDIYSATVNNDRRSLENTFTKKKLSLQVLKNPKPDKSPIFS